jgi:hypothetical protein
MTMELRVRLLLSAFVALCILAAAAVPSVAHPPWNPYDNTRFAPITRFGPKIGVEVVTRAMNTELGVPIGDLLISPLKVVTAPGLPEHIFVVDQIGKLWAVKLSDGTRTLYLNLSSRIVTLGVCGPDSFDERGFLGLAFHPNFDGQKSGAGKGLFYTFTSERRDTGVATIATPGTTSANADHHNVIAEWVAASPDNPTSPGITGPRELMRVNWPQFNHDGGDLAFGPNDGKLYISFGDGGGADDADGQPFAAAPPHKASPSPPFPDCSAEEPIFGHQDNGNGQKLNTPLGKILRIDVNPPFTTGKAYAVPSDNPFVSTADAVPEIYALGFRNPYRFSFDRKNDDLYVGNVGQNDIEEVELVRKGGNYSWNCKEGTLFFYINGSVPDDGFAHPSSNRPERPGDCTSGPRPLRDPIAQYDTHHEGHSVIGGYVYHGHEIPQLRGKYVFGDFSLLFKFPSGPHDYGRLFSIDARGRGQVLRPISELIVLPGGGVSLGVLGIGEDSKGELYVTGNVNGVPFGNNGVVLRLVPAPEADEDNGNDD